MNVYDQILENDEFLLNPADLMAFPTDVRQDLNRYESLVEEKKLLEGSYNSTTFVFQQKNEELKVVEGTHHRLPAKSAGRPL